MAQASDLHPIELGRHKRRGIGAWLGAADLWPAGMLALVVLTSLLIVVLILAVLGLSFLGGMPGDSAARYGLLNYAEVFTNPDVLVVLANTVEFSVVSLVIALVIGVPMAWFIVRTDMPGKPFLVGALTLALVIPGFATAMGWVFLLHPRIGLVNLWLKSVFGPDAWVINITSVPGMGWVQGLSLAPLVFVMTANVFRAMDPSLEEAAQMNGASWRRVISRITLPLAWPGILAACLYVFTIGFAAFDVPAVIGWGGQIFTFSTYLYQQINGINGLPRYGVGAALSTIVMALALLLSLFYVRMQRQAHRYVVVSGKAYRPKQLALKNWRYPVIAFFALYLILAELLPLLLLIWASLLPFFQLPSGRALSLISLGNYASLPWGLAVNAIAHTLVLMIVTPTVTLILSIAFSWVVFRSRIPGRRAFDVIAFLPHAIPNVVFGFAVLLLALYVLQSVVPIYGTIWVLAIAFVVARLSYGTRMTNSALIQLHRELEEAGQMAGGATGRVLRAITVPLLMPTLVYSWIWIALLTFRELTLAVMLTTTGNLTIPVLIWSLWGGGGLSTASALTVVAMLLVVPLLTLFWLTAGRRRGIDGAIS